VLIEDEKLELFGVNVPINDVTPIDALINE
jgi:hypothetical protein